MRFKLQRVEQMVKELEPGVFYVSDKFYTAAHLCACGCGSKVRTPLAETEWSFTDDPNGPTLYPSIGNWQLPCKSHYWILNGQVEWASKWTDAQIASGRYLEEKKRQLYYEELYGKKYNFVSSIIKKLKQILGF